MYIYGGSDAGQYTPIYQRAWDFNIKIPSPIDLQPGKWLLSLCELRVQREANVEGYFALFVDVIHPQPFYGQLRSILRTFSLEARENTQGEIIDHIIFQDRYYCNIHTGQFSCLQVKLKSIDGSAESEFIKTCCVFHLKHK